MTTDCPLIALPSVALKNVLENLDYKTIQRLRKTCHDLRNFIDDSRLEFGIYEVIIEVDNLMAMINVRQKNVALLSIRYLCAGADTNVARDIGGESKNVNLDGVRYHDAFLHDLTILIKTLKNQKKTCNRFIILKRHNVDYFEQVKRLLNDGKKLSTEQLTVFGDSDEEIFNTLACFDPKFVKTLSLANPVFFEPIRLLNLEKISTLELWKNAKILKMWPFDIDDVKPILHFHEAKISVNTLTPEHVRLLKETFESDGPLQSIKIWYVTTSDPATLDILGVPSTDRPDLDRNRYPDIVTATRTVIVRGDSGWLHVYESNYETDECE